MSAQQHVRLVGAIVARLDIEDLSEAIVVAMRERIPGYAELPESPLRGQVRELTGALLDLFSRVADDPDGLDEAEFEFVREGARARAGEGIALDEVLQAYLLGARSAWSGVVAGAGSADERDALLTAAERVMTFVDRLTSVVVATFLEERQHRLVEDARLVVELLDALVRDQSISEGLRSFAARIGFPILETYRAFAVARLEAPPHVHSQLAASLRLRGVLAIGQGDCVVGLISPDAESTSLTDGRTLIVFGEPARRAELAQAVDEARLLLSLARRAGQSEGPVDALALALPLLVARSPRLGEQLRRRVLGPLESYEGGTSGELFRTLRAYLAARMNRGRAAKALGVHPNTLDYRVGRIEQLCDLRLSAPDDLARIALALAHLDMEGV